MDAITSMSIADDIHANQTMAANRNRVLTSISQCQMIAIVVAFFAALLPWFFILLTKYIKRNFSQPPPGYNTFAYQEFSAIHSHEEVRYDRMTALSTFKENILYVMPSIVCSIVFGVSSFLLCKYLPT